MQTFIVVVLISLIALAMMATAWYAMRNVKYLRDSTEADRQWRRDQGLL
jgi:hypothetical protein